VSTSLRYGTCGHTALAGGKSAVSVAVVDQLRSNAPDAAAQPRSAGFKGRCIRAAGARLSDRLPPTSCSRRFGSVRADRTARPLLTGKIADQSGDQGLGPSDAIVLPRQGMLECQSRAGTETTFAITLCVNDQEGRQPAQEADAHG